LVQLERKRTRGRNDRKRRWQQPAGRGRRGLRFP
jgi:hypothetical protein